MAQGSESAPTEASSAPRHSVDIRMTQEQALFAEILEASMRTKYDTKVLLGDAAQTSTEGRHSDIVLLDEDVQCEMPSENPARLVMLGKELTDALIARCATTNADGCVITHTSGLADLLATIDAVMRGEWAYPHAMRTRMMELLSGLRAETHEALDCPLTHQEKKVLQLLVEEPGIANKKIAKILSISIYTVKNHMHNMLEKLGTESRHRARDLAVSRQWFSHSKI